MKLPALNEPQRYRGLYVFDFGEWTALGYTAEEIALLLESEQYRGGKVYQIVRAQPDGGLELRGVAPERFRLESGLFFNRETLDAAREDFRTLRELAQRTPPPGRAFVHLIDRGAHEGVPRYAVGLIYPAEYEDAVAQWLLASDYAGGDTVEGGPSHVTNYYAEKPAVLEREQLWPASATSSRSREAVYASVRQAVQR